MNMRKILALVASGVVMVACENEQLPETAPVTGGDIVSGMPGTHEHFRAHVKDRVFFALNSAKLCGESRETLMAQSAWLKAHPCTKAVVEGHCDQRGTRQFNIALGERRAQAAKAALIGNGVGSERLSTISYGKDNPPVPGNDPVAWAGQRTAITVIASSAPMVAAVVDAAPCAPACAPACDPCK